MARTITVNDYTTLAAAQADAKQYPARSFFLMSDTSKLYISNDVGELVGTAGDAYTLPAATPEALGGVLQAAAVDPASETFAVDLVAALQEAGLMDGAG